MDNVGVYFQQPDTVDRGKKKKEVPLQEGVKYEGQLPVGEPGRTVSAPELSDVKAAVWKGTLPGTAARAGSARGLTESGQHKVIPPLPPGFGTGYEEPRGREGTLERESGGKREAGQQDSQLSSDNGHSWYWTRSKH